MKIRLITARTKDGRSADLFVIEMDPEDAPVTVSESADLLAPFERHGFAAVATFVPLEDER